MFETLGSYHDLQKHGFEVWAGDNGRFWSKGTGVNPNWTEKEWLKMLDYYPEYMRTLCKFMVVPDVPFDAQGTINVFSQYLPFVVGRGYPAAFCTQDGMTPDDIPWGEIAAVFIGGSERHKLGQEGASIGAIAHSLGKWVHVGRVNSMSRMKQIWWADSCDGTHLAHNSALSRQRLLAEAVSFCRAKKRTRRLI